MNPKVYAYRCQAIENNNNIIQQTKAKGVSHVMVEKTLPFRTYEKTLDTDKTARRGIPIILSLHQEIVSISDTKDCLAS